MNVALWRGLSLGAGAGGIDGHRASTPSIHSCVEPECRTTKAQLPRPSTGQRGGIASLLQPRPPPTVANGCSTGAPAPPGFRPCLPTDPLLTDQRLSVSTLCRSREHESLARGLQDTRDLPLHLPLDAPWTSLNSACFSLTGLCAVAQVGRAVPPGSSALAILSARTTPAPDA